MKKEFVETKVWEVFKDTFCPEVFIIRLNWPRELLRAPGPGQFVVLEPLNKASVMPRPFSVIDFSHDSLFLAVKIAGENTKLYSELKKGDKIMVSGPHGRYFTPKSDKEYIFVGGGVGSAGLLYLAKSMAQYKNRPLVLLGGKKSGDIFGLQYFKDCVGINNIRTITEEGSGGGRVTDLLEEAITHSRLREPIIVACGPKPMLKAVAKLAKGYGNECFVSMEEVMACAGSGACYGCAVPMKEGPPKRLCQDGPIFDADEIDFSKIMGAKTSGKLQNKKQKTDTPLRVVLSGKEGRELVMDSPIMYASGCVALSSLLSGATDFLRAGAIVAKGIELNPRHGNATPRVCEVYGGMLNAIGLQGAGIKEFKSKILPKLLRLNKPIIVNISGGTKEEYAEVASELVGTGIAGIEINISCPNKEKGMLFGQDKLSAAAATKAVREVAPREFLIVKLTPNVTDIVGVAKYVVEYGGADAVSLINTVVGMDIDVRTRRPKLANIKGGYSGPGILPIALAKVYDVAQAVDVPIIGMGGIRTGEDAAKFIIAGASVVAIGTGNFSNSNVITEVYDDLLKIMKLHGANHIHDLKGALII